MADDEPVKSVSSLRSRFEQMASPNAPATPTTVEPPALRRSHTGADNLRGPDGSWASRTSFEISRRDTVAVTARGGEFTTAGVEETHSNSAAPRPQIQNGRQRPQSVYSTFSVPRSPPTFRVDSPQPSEKQSNPRLRADSPDRWTSQAALNASSSGTQLPRANGRSELTLSANRSARTPPPPPPPPPPPVSPRGTRPSSCYGSDEIIGSRRQSLANESTRRAPLSPALQQLQDHPGISSEQEAGNPPVPVRTTKPKIPSKPSYPPRHTRSETVSGALVPATFSDERVSPFSTPPSSANNSPIRNNTGRPAASAPPPRTVPTPKIDYGPPPVHFSVAEKRDISNTMKSAHMNGNSIASPPPLLAPTPPAPPPPRKSIDGRMSLDGVRPKMNVGNSIRGSRMSVDDAGLRPVLPPRPLNTGGMIGSVRARVSGSRGRSYSPPRVASPTEPASTPSFPAPPKRGIGSIKSRATGFPGSWTNRNVSGVSTASAMTSATSATVESTDSLGTSAYGFDESDADISDDQSGQSDYPDTSQANRRKPYFKQGPESIKCKSDIRLFSVSGQYVCTVHHSTRVWDVETGQCIMELRHGEGTRITAVEFKPMAKVSDEGSMLWLGTAQGELLEADIATQRIVESRASAHTKREVIRIHRHAYELWTIDNGGKLQLWASDEYNGGPNLRNSPYTFRMPAKYVCSIVIDGLLWVASGKNVDIYQPSTDPQSVFNVLQRPLTSNKPTLSITCCAVVNSQPDKVYFGHADGKVSVYSRKTFSFLEVIAVSPYKINSMTGVGDYLWAGFNTGMIYVYDVHSRPWRVLKDWKCHDVPVMEVVADRTSIWKNGRLQVMSLGSNGTISIWDGMLEEDWLEDDMQKHDVEYCSFREIKALVCTWNAGATKPQDLLTRECDRRFLEDVLNSVESPDIIVFGFQELVELEDKKVMAKSIFKGKRKKQTADRQEHISHQYRLWQQQLEKSIEHYMPHGERYSLLQSTNLVGLFTCIFVKSSERTNVRGVCTAQVKTGVKGMVGNKGAIITRFYMDDSSLCFVNCHLAAGQKHTRERNHDIATILEAEKLAAEATEAGRSDMFVGGGDGSMILDHEICILNGDLNYRIEMPRDNVVHRVKVNDIAPLLERDQLLKERKNNPGFRLRVFNELPLTFYPTYKYDVGTDNYDTSEKKRAPAWCDRLLYRGIGKVKQTDYRRWEVKASDHRPVSGSFMIRLKTVDPYKKKRAREQSAERYNKARARHVWDAQMDYLVNVMGLSPGEAQRDLGDKNEIVHAILSSTPPVKSYR